VEPTDIIALVMRWLHILSAIALMGGSIFMRFALHPALAALGAEQQKALKAAASSTSSSTRKAARSSRCLTTPFSR
jgi:uncharacterized membrane protein